MDAYQFDSLPNLHRIYTDTLVPQSSQVPTPFLFTTTHTQAASNRATASLWRVHQTFTVLYPAFPSQTTWSAGPILLPLIVCLLHPLFPTFLLPSHPSLYLSKVTKAHQTARLESSQTWWSQPTLGWCVRALRLPIFSCVHGCFILAIFCTPITGMLQRSLLSMSKLDSWKERLGLIPVLMPQ